MCRIVYTKQYNIGFFGLERLHPFDSRKYGRAWRVLRQQLGSDLRRMWIRPPRPVNREELLSVHTADYLAQLCQPNYVAGALELPPLKHLPGFLIDHCVLRPMRWATMGSMIAAKEAITHGFVVNLSGGYHHAKPTCGEGFSIYNDIALAVHSLREQGLLQDQQRVAYVDLDAHQGNGVCYAFMNDDRFFIFDMYNHAIYPSYDYEATERIDCRIGVSSRWSEKEYLQELKTKLPGFLDSITNNESVGLAIYNAGTDVFIDDPLGLLNLSAQAILDRDLYVVEQLRQRGLPTMMLLSGGYTKESYQLVADSVFRLVQLDL